MLILPDHQCYQATDIQFPIISITTNLNCSITPPIAINTPTPIKSFIYDNPKCQPFGNGAVASPWPVANTWTVGQLPAFGQLTTLRQWGSCQPLGSVIERVIEIAIKVVEAIMKAIVF